MFSYITVWEKTSLYSTFHSIHSTIYLISYKFEIEEYFLETSRTQGGSC